MSTGTKILLAGIAATLLLAIAGAAGFLWHIARPRIVAQAVTPDGVEFCVIQKCNWSAELFTTSFVYRKPGGDWGWFYYDHEDDYWGQGRVVLRTNAQVAVIYRGRQPAVTFNWATETFTLHRWNRTLTGAQTYLPKGWSPP